MSQFLKQMGPTVRDVVTGVNSQSFLPPFALKLYLTTTSLFEQINPSSADCITLPGKFSLNKDYFTFRWVHLPESIELLRHSLPRVRMFKR